MQVYSAYRLVEGAKKAVAGTGVAVAGPARHRRVVIVTVGHTRGDALADLKLELLVGEAVSRAACHPRLLLPRAAWT